MTDYLLHHRHSSTECSAVYAAWKGFESPLRKTRAISTCLEGGHAIWWRVHAGSPDEALALLPPFVAERTTVTPTREVSIP